MLPDRKRLPGLQVVDFFSDCASPIVQQLHRFHCHAYSPSPGRRTLFSWRVMLRW